MPTCYADLQVHLLLMNIYGCKYLCRHRDLLYYLAHNIYHLSSASYLNVSSWNLVYKPEVAVRWICLHLPYRRSHGGNPSSHSYRTAAGLSSCRWCNREAAVEQEFSICKAEWKKAVKRSSGMFGYCDSTVSGGGWWKQWCHRHVSVSTWCLCECLWGETHAEIEFRPFTLWIKWSRFIANIRAICSLQNFERYHVVMIILAVLSCYIKASRSIVVLVRDVPKDYFPQCLNLSLN